MSASLFWTLFFLLGWPEVRRTLSSLFLFLHCLCLKQPVPSSLPSLSLLLTPEPRSQGCWGTLSSVPTGDRRKWERAVRVPQEAPVDSGLPASSLELTFLKLEYGAGRCPKAPVETAAPWEPLSCFYSTLLQHTIGTEKNWRLLVSDWPPVVPKEQEEGDTERGPGRVECIHPAVVLSLFTVDCPQRS